MSAYSIRRKNINPPTAYVEKKISPSTAYIWNRQIPFFQQASKFNETEAQYLLEWIRDATNENFSVEGKRDNFQAVLRDGVILCK